MKAAWNGTVIAENDSTEVVDGETNAEPAWCYKEPKSAATQIKGHLAF